MGDHKKLKANAVWIALVNSILVNWKKSQSGYGKTFTYEEIARIVEDKRPNEQAGASSMNYPLGAIHKAIKVYNRLSGESVPPLNALVVGKKNNEPGDGLPENFPLKDMWKFIYAKGQNWLVGLTSELGFETSIVHDYKVTKTGTTKFVPLAIAMPASDRKVTEKRLVPIEGDLGVAERTIRSECWVIPKHHEVAKAVGRFLTRKGTKNIEFSGVRPDFFVQFRGERSVFEVKPDATLQSIATGIGQLLLYGKALDAEALYLALPDAEPGSKFAKMKSIRSILRDTNIWIVPMMKMKDGTYKAGQLWSVPSTPKKELRKVK